MTEPAGIGARPTEARPSVWLRYGFALVLSAFSLVATIGLQSLLAGSVFLMFFPSIIAAAWFSGFRPALLVVGIAMLTADVLFVQPVGTLTLGRPTDAVWLASYALVAATVAYSTALLVRLRAESEAGRREQAELAGRLEETARELRHRVAESERLLEERTRAQEALRESEQRFRRMADHAPVLIWEAGPDGQCTYFNLPWLEFTGRTPERELAGGWAEGVHPDDRERCVASYRAALADHTPFRLEYRRRRRDGQYRWLLDAGTPRYDGPGGDFAGFIGSCIDIHDHIELQEELESTTTQLEELTVEQEQMVDELQLRSAEADRAREEAQEANQAKSRFLAVMSHELRTPLNAILGYSDLLAGGVGGPVNEVQARHVDRIRRSVMHLRDLIDQILSLSRIEAGREELHVTDFDLAGLVRDAAEMIVPQAERRGLDVGVRLGKESIPVRGDAGKVRQILLNLLSNAVKFTERGSVEVRAEPGEDGVVSISVRDTGVGIAPDDVARIFDAFTQVDQSMTRRSAGTGLGLAVSRELAELMEGTLTASSTPGEGSTFRLRLPRTLDRGGLEGRPHSRAG